MLWPMLTIALGFLGLTVLAVPAVRVYVEVRRLAGQVAESSRRIADATGDLEHAAEDLARTGRTLRQS
ncbi:hypothetical protein [Streptomyces sp. NPDC012888]|uniref:hypothetical protein n=1 Tax=Streptomyces sp. NPDC012888 TaxID=3364855 RepID=UPI0036947A75